MSVGFTNITGVTSNIRTPVNNLWKLRKELQLTVPSGSLEV